MISIVLMAWAVNLLSSFLTLLAIAFYVVVYTILLKRTTPQNIVIGGAAGALPPVIGWAAVTGRVEVPALLLFAMVFYWTPPHFWALAAPDPQGLRGRQGADAAGRPRRARDRAPDPPVHGAARRDQPGVLRGRRDGPGLPRRRGRAGRDLPVAGVRLYRQASSPEGSLAQAIRLYKYSISYLTLLFLAVAVDALVVARVG